MSLGNKACMGNEGTQHNYLDCIQTIVSHVHAKEYSATCTPAQVLDDHILVHKGAPTKLG